MPKPLDIRLKSWKEFPSALKDIEEAKEAKATKSGRRLNEPLFRGLGNDEWKLETTLERSVDADHRETLLSYYRRISRSKPIVESLMNRNWDDIPEWPDFEKLLHDEGINWIDRTLSQRPSIYQYLLYLRHHGFPSPILDWTASPYVAAVFAFDVMDRAAESVVVWAYLRDSLQSFSNDAHLFTVGPYIKTHPRHYIQQSRYSLCVRHMVEQRGENRRVDYEFLQHDEVLEGSLNDDLIVRIRIPASERKLALLDLDSMNLNPYSLYGSEESLIRTIARREMFFKDE